MVTFCVQNLYVNGYYKGTGVYRMHIYIYIYTYKKKAINLMKSYTSVRHKHLSLKKILSQTLTFSIVNVL